MPYVNGVSELHRLIGIVGQMDDLVSILIETPTLKYAFLVYGRLAMNGAKR